MTYVSMDGCKYKYCTAYADFGDYCVDHLNNVDNTVYKKSTLYVARGIHGKRACKYCANRTAKNEKCCNYHKYVMNIPFTECTERMKHQIYHEIYNAHKGKCTKCNKENGIVVKWGSSGISTDIICAVCNNTN